MPGLLLALLSELALGAASSGMDYVWHTGRATRYGGERAAPLIIASHRLSLSPRAPPSTPAEPGDPWSINTGRYALSHAVPMPIRPLSVSLHPLATAACLCLCLPTPEAPCCLCSTVASTAILTRMSALGGTWLPLLTATTTTQALAGALVPPYVQAAATLYTHTHALPPFPLPPHLVCCSSAAAARRRCYEVACQNLHITDGYGNKVIWTDTLHLHQPHHSPVACIIQPPHPTGDHFSSLPLLPLPLQLDRTTACYDPTASVVVMVSPAGSSDSKQMQPLLAASTTP